MKKLDMTKNDVYLLLLFFISLPLLMAGIFLKSLVVIAGVAGLVICWFLCVDHIIANPKMLLPKRILFAGIVVLLPLISYMSL